MVLSSFLTSLLSGAAAGTSTDLVFFPIDTLKTRLQAKGGFFANGGYHGIYRGLGSAIVASAPSASLFFISYDTMKVEARPYIEKLIQNTTKNDAPSTQLADTLTHMFSSSVGEVAACLVRVPAEVIKQRTQVHKTNSSLQTLKIILRNENGDGIRKNLYRGWSTTIMREIPFTCIQFPLYEFLKKKWKEADASDGPLNPVKGAISGSIAGGVAAATTTPLDFLKTRLMLNKTSIPVRHLVQNIYRDEGFKIFFSGIIPRTMWISAGGAIFLGVYEMTHYVIDTSHLLSTFP
ncbi:Pet8p NDAI_0G00160 [Naumovozyma dairenensis CBS 421]|uniref:Putative mitochondrial carrier protein PET8 n=1 Tax=Naumovozyma dairenensis (strain ATCC 10597 / BCRC 20456 / CBS 421 / NBRC 0211 / NRRL Y-12639) TaxID=1071378 RepID=G0WDD1_NAUDC|nr:hypothetical protein NDAI_0G00160 [Naumovozyma dairenensis CBS 421]CCD25792.2 hypothetical protein NDAI_0G00160 [Naumovozyma dairenensis CBS 421]